MGLLRLSFFVFGFFVIASASKCLPQTAKCSEYWVKIEPHKNFMETEMDLNLWCNKQMQFYKCLEEVLLEGKSGSLSHLPTSLLVSKLFAQDLCSDGSNSRKRLLNNAACVNQLNTDYCSLPEYLDIVTPDYKTPPSPCSLSERTFSCIAATMVLNCGFDAARVYRAMLKITRYSDEVCDIEMSEGIPHCEERKQDDTQRDEKLSEIYYGLVHRIGTIPNQELDESVSSDKYSDPEVNVEDAVTEAIKSALDSLGEDADSEEYDADDATDEASLNRGSNDLMSAEISLKKNPIITEVYRGILFYNFSGIEYSLYWRQPEFVIIENITCEQLNPKYVQTPIFKCTTEYRYEDPACVHSDSVHEKISPELIRELDPEIPVDSTTEYGPRPAWMEELDEAYEEKRLRDELKSAPTNSAEEIDIPYTTGSALLHLATTLTNPEEYENWWEYDFNFNSILPNDVKEELMDLFLPEPEKYQPSPIHQFMIGNTYVFLIHDPLITHAIENMTCSRLNECHPKGRGLWRCNMWTRKIETCKECYGRAGAEVSPVSYVVADSIANSKRFMEKLKSTDETLEAEGSELFEDETSSEDTIALTYSGDLASEEAASEEAASEEAADASSVSNVHIVSEEENEAFSEVDSTTESAERHSEIEGNEADSSERGIGILLLEQKPDSSTENASEFMYTVDDSEESGEIFPLEDEHEILHKNVLVFQGVPGAVNLEDLYTILNVSDDTNVVDSEVAV